MIFTSTGQVWADLYVLGHSATPSYLLNTRQPALFDAGFSCLGPAYYEDAVRVLGDKQPVYLFLTHVHFDHCGAVSYLKSRFPNLKVLASKKASEIIKRPGAQKLITMLNQKAHEHVKKIAPSLVSEIEFKPFEIDEIIGEGDEIKLGPNHTVKVMETVGHTWDFITFHIPEQDILISSEAAGCQDSTDYIVTEFLVDYDKYLDSIKRFCALKAEVLLQGHRKVYLGPDVQLFLQRSLKSAKDYKSFVDSLLIKHKGDIEKVMSLVKAAEYDDKPEPKQPESAYLLNLKARVTHLAKKMGMLPRD